MTDIVPLEKIHKMLKEQLEKPYFPLKRVATETEIDYQWLRNFNAGETPDPKIYDRLTQLYKYLAEQSEK